VFAIVGVPVSLAIFELGLRHARTTGTLGHQ
jgi:hypothetical protein